jgi:hypothetical protein
LKNEIPPQMRKAQKVVMDRRIGTNIHKGFLITV